MTEHEARKLCTERGRDPDRDMTGPNGPLKAWEMYARDESLDRKLCDMLSRTTGHLFKASYDTQALADELNHKPDETQDGLFRDGMTEAQARKRCYKHMAKLYRPNETRD